MRENRNLISGLVIILLLWLVLTKNMTWWLNISTVINRLGLGIGAILAGASGFVIIRDLMKERNERQLKNKLMKKFSALTRDKENIKIWKAGDPIYAIDETNQTHHHIKPFSTFRELGYPDDGWDKEVTRKEIEKYSVGETIDFS